MSEPCGACGGSGFRYGPRKIKCWCCHGAGTRPSSPPEPRPTRARLEEAWEISALPGAAYVAASHAFVCHEDGSDCTPTCGEGVAVHRENLAMLDCARELREVSSRAELGDFVRLWTARAVSPRRSK